MRFRNYLDKILGQKTKIKALRYLINYKENISIRALSRAIKVTPPNLAIILAELKKEGVLTSREYGRSVVYSLNYGHYLVDQVLLPLFRSEHDVLGEIKTIINKKFIFSYESIVLFGSMARGDEHPGSDIDLLIVVGNKKDKEIAGELILDVSTAVVKKFGNQLSPYILTRNEFVAKYKNKDLLVLKIANEGELLAGKLISELL